MSQCQLTVFAITATVVTIALEACGYPVFRPDTSDIAKATEGHGLLSAEEFPKLVIEGVTFFIHYVWHHELIDAINQVQKKLYGLEGKIDKLLAGSYSYQAREPEYDTGADYY